MAEMATHPQSQSNLDGPALHLGGFMSNPAEKEAFANLPLELQELYASLHAQQRMSPIHIPASRLSPVLPSPSAQPATRTEEDSVGESAEEGCDNGKKKLSKKQVQELEGLFQAGYTGAPEGRGPIARKMGISSRQVAIWFQNRRARQRNKQITRDFEMLKKDFRTVFLENQVMRKELVELRARVRSLAERDPVSVPQPSRPEGHGPSTDAVNPEPEFRTPKAANLLENHWQQFAGRRGGAVTSATGVQRTESLPQPKRAKFYQTEGDPFRRGPADPGGSQVGLQGVQASSGLLDSVVSPIKLRTPGDERFERALEEFIFDGLVGREPVLGSGHEGASRGFELLGLGAQAVAAGQGAHRSFLEEMGNLAAQAKPVVGLQDGGRSPTRSVSPFHEWR